jgi:uncharacterized membrane protein YbhN (UPF0104 family)
VKGQEQAKRAIEISASGGHNILMIGSPTPGGAGVAELMFSNFLGEFIDNKSLTILLTIIWRMMSYYPYIIVGAIVLPRWIKRVWKD